MASSSRKKFTLMAIGMSKGGDMRNPRDTHQNQLVPTVVEQTNRGERVSAVHSVPRHVTRGTYHVVLVSKK